MAINNVTKKLDVDINILRTTFGSFLNLTDTPATYAGAESNFIKVNATGTGVEFSQSSAVVAWNEIAGDQSLINLSGFTNDAGFLVGNQTITLSGDVSGSGTTAITATLGNDTVTTVKILNENVTKAKLSTAVQSSLDLADSALQGLDQQVSLIYVSKTGSNTNTGLSVQDSVLTIGQALTIASSIVGAKRIEIMDGGTYTESFSVPADVNVVGTGATIEGSITITAGAEVHIDKHFSTANNQNMLSMDGGGDGPAIYTVNISDGRSHTGVLNVRNIGGGGKNLFVRVGIMYVGADGVGLTDTTGGFGHIHLLIPDLYLGGNNAVGIRAIAQGANTTNIIGFIDHILEIGSPTGTTGLLLNNANGIIKVTVNEIIADTVYNITAGQLYLTSQRLVGTKTGTPTMELSKDTFDAKLQNGDNVSELTNDAGYITSAGAPVQSVNGDTGIVVLDKTDIGLSNVDDVQQIPLTQKGAVNGVAELDANSKVPLSQINDAILGQVSYQGTWNASTNTPTLPDATTVKGDYYVTSTGGTFNTIPFEVGDWVISNGVEWQKVDNTDAVSSVFGRTGVVTAQTNDYTWAQINKTTSNIADITTKSHTSLTDIGTNSHAQIDSHISSTSNPHSVTKTQVGLSNVDNTSDANKPVSTAQQTALDLKANTANAMGVVVHGATAGTARPTGYAQVIWIGSVDPTNKATGDLWVDNT